jgi:hypothetical protein
MVWWYSAGATWYDGCEYRCQCSQKLEILCQPRYKFGELSPPPPCFPAFFIRHYIGVLFSRPFFPPILGQNE